MAIILYGNLPDSNTGEEMLILNGEATKEKLSKVKTLEGFIWEVDGEVKAKQINNHLIVYKVPAEKSRKWKNAKD
jgi:hypothetical protein